MATAVATDEPEIAAKTVVAVTHAIARPPVKRPTQAFAQLTRACAIPPFCMKVAETMQRFGVDFDNYSGRMLEQPSRADIPLAVQEQLIVELYSK